MERIGNILFVIAGGLWAIELIPQLFKTVRTKKVRDISLFFLVLCFVAYIIFIIGSFLIKNSFLFFSQLVPFLNVSILLYLVLKYKNPKARLKYLYRKKVKELKKRKIRTPLKTIRLLEDGNYEEEPYIVNGKCINKGEHICNKGYACNVCPYNKDLK